SRAPPRSPCAAEPRAIGPEAAARARTRARSDARPTVRKARAAALGVPLVWPGMRRIGVAAQLPVPEPVERQKLDSVNPLGSLPGIELGSDDAHRTAVLDRQRLALGGVHQQHVILERLFQGKVGGVPVVG